MDSNFDQDQTNSGFSEEIKKDLINKREIQHSKNKEFDYYNSRLQHELILSGKESQKSKESYTVIEKEMTPEIRLFLKESFSNHFIGNERTNKEAEAIISMMFCVKIEKDSYLFKEGDKPRNFYILEEGTFEMSKKKQVVSVLNRGSLIGARSAIYDSFRQSNFLATTDSILWAIPIALYRKMIEKFCNDKYDEYRIFLEKVNLFSDLSPEHKNDLVYYVKSYNFKKGETLIKEEGDNKSKKISIFIIKEGKIAIYIKDNLNRILEKGECFGENSLLHSKRTYTAIAQSDVVECFALSQEIMDTILGDKIQTIVIKNIKRNCFKHSKYLRHLSPFLIEKIINEMTEECYTSGVEILHHNELMEKLIFIVKGNLITHGSLKFPEGNCFLEDSLMVAEFKNPYENIYTDSIGLLSEITKGRFEEIIGSTLETYINANKEKDEIEFYEQFQSAMSSQTLNKEFLDKEDIKIIKEIGEGITGIILLVSYHNILYGLKIISKGWIVENNLEKYLINEKSICESINFSFITHLCLTFKDEISIYFMTEFIRGVEFYDFLRTIGIFKTGEARFYIVSLLLSIHYLHLKGIVHRDIKPENIMIDEQGYIKLLHLASAKILESNLLTKKDVCVIAEEGTDEITDKQFFSKMNKTFTIVGTPHYCAPEMILMKGYGFAVDYWSLGVCMYEFLCGFVPFGEDSEDPMEIYKLIIKNKVEFPEYMKDKNGKKLIRQFLSKSPEARTKGSFYSIQTDAWFGNLDWEGMIKRNVKPPFIPSHESMISDYEVKKAIGKGITLQRLTEDQSLSKIKEMTEGIKQNYDNWDEIF